MENPTISTSPDELVTGRDFRREFAGRMDQLAEGKVEKLVLMKHGKMVGVVLTVEEYARLAQGQA
jgi:PHD/YefM family antitoxin component YafN of YafNO toxin-antitoxin module